MEDTHFSPLKILASLAALTVVLSATCAHAQTDPKAVEAVRAAVASQMRSDHNDHSNWVYTDHDVTPGKNFVYKCVGSPQGELRLPVESNGHRLDASARRAALNSLESYVNDPSAQARKEKNRAHDAAQATELLKMLPDAFIWTIASETPDLLTLNYHPNPNFNPPDMESRVMSALSGQLVIERHGDLIYSLRGTLSQNVNIGFGLLARLYKGGTIDVERRDVGTNHWEIVTTHIHISGHALFFKTIGTEQDEVKTDWQPSTAQSLHDALEQLRDTK
jgi:hypothetical protein